MNAKWRFLVSVCTTFCLMCRSSWPNAVEFENTLCICNFSSCQVFYTDCIAVEGWIIDRPECCEPYRNSNNEMKPVVWTALEILMNRLKNTKFIFLFSLFRIIKHNVSADIFLTFHRNGDGLQHNHEEDWRQYRPEIFDEKKKIIAWEICWIYFYIVTVLGFVFFFFFCFGGREVFWWGECFLFWWWGVFLGFVFFFFVCLFWWKGCFLFWGECFVLVGWYLCHINFYRLFTSKSVFMQIISSISNDSV